MTIRSMLFKIIRLLVILQASVIVFGRPVPRRIATVSEVIPKPNTQEMIYGRMVANTSSSQFRRVIVESEENVPAGQCCTKCEAYLKSHNSYTAEQLSTCASLCQNDGIVGSMPAASSPSPTPRIGITVLEKAQSSER
ncbi:hypothetical protein J3R30DRAFT_3484617 [Lentinula aciculospora]|uniref:Secreted protein n=1 Tax=Lentinula aciculospora TaxID=153920 RepID=A0A9W9A8X9_9AGAR|nr:hypothetical protein J3R30DRAFT_3484617 [Lentinula aciculospora]